MIKDQRRMGKSPKERRRLRPFLVWKTETKTKTILFYVEGEVFISHALI
jgi:hypothetical protein